MQYRYVAYIPDDWDHNHAATIDGLKGIKLSGAGRISQAWIRDYENDIPLGCHFGTGEFYCNGAANLFVRDESERVVGLIAIRPKE